MRPLPWPAPLPEEAIENKDIGHNSKHITNEQNDEQDGSSETAPAPFTPTTCGMAQLLLAERKLRLLLIVSGGRGVGCRDVLAGGYGAH